MPLKLYLLRSQHELEDGQHAIDCTGDQVSKTALPPQLTVVATHQTDAVSQGWVQFHFQPGAHHEGVRRQTHSASKAIVGSREYQAKA